MKLRVLPDARLIAPVGQEDDPPFRPRGIGDLVAGSCEAPRSAAPCGNDPDAVELVAEPVAVEAPREIADLPGDRIVPLADAKSVLAARGKEEQRLSVRRPGSRADLSLQLGHL